MVYCGKPSKACQQCRDRKVKCDLKDECRQCVRARLVCSGPRDPTQLVFRDESRAVATKALARRAAKLHPVIIAISIEERAKGFFWSHYVLGNSSTFDYIQPICGSAENEHHLAASIDAVSLAHFSNKAHSSEALEKANHQYIAALRRTNTALASPESAVKDATFLTVLFLDLFEKMARSTPRPLESLTSHAIGAITLAGLRGHNQFQDPIGRRMFVQLTSTVLINCVQSDTPVPAGLLELRRKATRYTDARNPKWQFSEQIIRFVELRVTIKEGSISGSDVILSSRRIDSDLLRISTDMPPDWMYETISKPRTSPDVYGAHFDVYPDRRVTQNWNNIRLTRILLNEMILKQCQEDFDACPHNFFSLDCTNEIQTAKDTIISLSEEICASVPQYTRLLGIPNDLVSSNHSLRALISRDKPFSVTSSPISSSSPYMRPEIKLAGTDYTPFEAARCYSLLFPLYIACQSTVCPERMRNWIINRLYVIGSTFHIKEASLMVGFLERRETINPWSLYAMIGSYSFSA